MRTITSLSTIAALAFSLAACSAAAPADTGKTPDTKPAATATPTPSEAASEFGEAVKNSAAISSRRSDSWRVHRR